MGDCCPWESATAQRYLPKKDNSTLRSLSPNEQTEERDRREKLQRRWERKMVKRDLDHDFHQIDEEDFYDDRDGPSAMSVLWGSKKNKDEPSRDKKKSGASAVFDKLRGKRDQKGDRGDWKKIP